MKVAIGLAVPAIEAWLHCGRDPHCTEAALVRALAKENHVVIKNQLKQQVYGTDLPALAHARQRAIEQATRLVRELDCIERLFPAGFGALARACRSW